MRAPSVDEWRVIETLLPEGWREAARERKAFRRARYLKDPAALLRLLLFHSVNDAGLRETVAQARASGIAEMSQVALLKRLRTSGAWLSWIASELCRALRESSHLPQGLRSRAIDSTTVQRPGSKGADWRVHYSLDLSTLTCDWCEVTEGTTPELLERVPMQPGDVILGDRNYMRTAAVSAATKQGAFVLLRMRWNHPAMHDGKGQPFIALNAAARVRVGQVRSWNVGLVVAGGESILGRVVITRLPAPIAAKSERRVLKRTAKKSRKVDPRSLKAAHYVMVFTTVSAEVLPDDKVLEFYRYRWQIELAFKRLKQLLKLGHLPHKDPTAARSWILAKLVVALLLETLFRGSRDFSPWGYRLERLAMSPAD